MKKENFSSFRKTLIERIKSDFGLEPGDLDLHEAAIRAYYVNDWNIEKILDYYEEKYNLNRINKIYY